MGDGLAVIWHLGTPTVTQKAEAEMVLKPAGQVTWNRHSSSRIYERLCFKRVDSENRFLKVVL